MNSNVVSNIPGIEFYPVIALILFFGVFIGLIVWFFRVDKNNLELQAARVMQDDADAKTTHHSSQVP
jgi:cbb3-type cytochrome oxidase subunit 3